MQDRIASYVPRLLRRQSVDAPDKPAASVDRFGAAVLLADISGFTSLAERLAKKGSAGAEELTATLNAYFGPMIDLIDTYGGDVVKFAGDALLVLWPGQVVDDLERAALLATACGLALQKEVERLKTGAGIPLDLKVAVGAGQVALAQLGGVLGRWEFVLMGEALGRLSEAARQAKPGELVLAADAWSLVAAHSEGKPVGGGCHRVGGVRTAMALPDRQVVGSRQEVGRLEGVEGRPGGESLQGFLPGAVRDRVLAGHQDWLSELRQISVLFVNLPDLHDDMPLPFAQDLVQALQVALYRYEGSLNKLSVDDKGVSLVAVLGLPPLSHSDDATRALQAASAMRAVLAERSLRGSIGVATGKAFCGEVGNSSRREYTVIGDVVNLAARLMQAAGDDVLCDEVTAAGSRSRYEVEALPPVCLKGKQEPVQVFRPVREIRSPRKRGERSERSGGMVGRDVERRVVEDMLVALWEGGGSAVLVIEGEAGIGKSSLAAHALERCEALGIRSVVAEASAIERTTPFHAWRGVFDRILGVEDLDGDALRQRVLAELAAQGEEHRSPLVNVVIPASLAGTEFTDRLEGSARADQTLDLLVALLRRWQAGQPLAVVVEDSHWLDTASWSLAAALARRLGNLLLVLVTRPMDAPLPGDCQALRETLRAEVIRLEGLPAEAALGVAARRLGVTELPPELTRVILDRSGGHPYFCEELACALRDSGAIEVVGGKVRVADEVALGKLNLPSTIEGVLTSRIDRLPPAEQLTLKVASVIGRVFPVRTLQAVHPMAPPEAELMRVLNALEQADLTPKESPEPELAYAFKHALAQEAAYELLLHSQRRAVHEHVAAWYEARPEAERDAHIPLLAHHYERAGRKDKALEYLTLAGEQAIANSAAAEARQFLERALPLAQELDSGPLLLRIKAGLGTAARYQSRSAEAIAEYDEAIALAEAAGDVDVAASCRVGQAISLCTVGKTGAALAALDQAQTHYEAIGASRDLARVLLRKARVQYMKGQPLLAMEMANRALHLAGKVGLEASHAQAQSFLGGLYASADVGGLSRSQSLELAKAYLSEAVEVFRKLRDGIGLFDALSLLGTALWTGSDFRGARQAHSESLSVAVDFGAESDVICALLNVAMQDLETGELASAVSLAREARARSQRADLPEYRLYSLCLEALGLAHTGASSEARLHVGEAVECLDSWTGDNEQMVKMAALPYLAEVELILGDIASATSHSQEALALALNTGVHEYEPRSRCLLGTCLLLEGDPQGAAQHFEAALATGQDLGALGTISRAFHGLSRAALLHGDPDLSIQYADEALSNAQVCGASLLVTELETWRAELLSGEPG